MRALYRQASVLSVHIKDRSQLTPQRVYVKSPSHVGSPGASYHIKALVVKTITAYSFCVFFFFKRNGSVKNANVSHLLA